MAENENKLPKPLKFAYFSFTSFSSLFDNNNENDGGSVSGNWKKYIFFGISLMRYIEGYNFIYLLKSFRCSVQNEKNKKNYEKYLQTGISLTA